MNPRHLLQSQAVTFRDRVWLPSVAQVAGDIALEQGAFLQVCCGSGWLCVHVAAGHAELDAIGLDPDEHRLALAERNKGPRLNVTFRQMPSSRIVYPDGTFAAAASFAASHRWDDVPATLAEVWRVLDKGGRFYVYEADAGASDFSAAWFQPVVPELVVRRMFQRRAVSEERWDTLKRAVQQSPFGGGEDGRHGPYRRLVLTR